MWADDRVITPQWINVQMQITYIDAANNMDFLMKLFLTRAEVNPKGPEENYVLELICKTHTAGRN